MWLRLTMAAILPRECAGVVAGQEELHLGVFEEGIPARVEEFAAFRNQRGNPVGVLPVDLPRETNEPFSVCGSDDFADMHEGYPRRFSILPTF